DALADLLARFGLRDAFTEGRDEMGWLRHLYDGYRTEHPELPDFDRFWEIGAAALAGRPAEADRRHALRHFVAEPERAPLDTPSAKIELGSAEIAGFRYDDCPGRPAWLAPEEWLGAPMAARYPLHLLSPQPEGKLHSQLDAARNSMRFKAAGRERIH